MKNETTEWRSIKGFPYQVSSDGQIRRVFPTKRTKLVKLLDHEGRYLRVGLHNKGEVKTFLVHRIVGESFCDHPEGCNVIHHRDNNGLNNHYTNIIWTTQKENVRLAFEDGLIDIKKRRGKLNPNYKNGKYVMTDEQLEASKNRQSIKNMYNDKQPIRFPNRKCRYRNCRNILTKINGRPDRKYCCSKCKRCEATYIKRSKDKLEKWRAAEEKLILTIKYFQSLYERKD